jgi:hypothetical protein
MFFFCSELFESTHRDKSLPWMYGINEIVTILYLRQNMAGSCNVEETWMSIPDALLA